MVDAKPLLSEQEFAEGYAKRSGVTVEWLKKMGHEARPCYCGEDICEGWQMVNVTDWEEDQRMRGLM